MSDNTLEPAVEYLCLRCDDRQLVPHNCENCGDEPKEFIAVSDVRDLLDEGEELPKEMDIYNNDEGIGAMKAVAWFRRQLDEVEEQ